ncbi:MAG: methylenetetrahydrofolate reductase [Dehalococcoidia bacterium]
MARSHLQEVLESGRFAVTAELTPPRSASTEYIARQAVHFRDVDAINFTDNVSARVRMSSLAACVLAMREGLEPVLQIACRDKNRLAIQSEVIGASVLGIRNVLCLTGDHQTRGDHPMAKGVFDLDSIQLIRMVRRMRDEQTLDTGGPLKKPPELFIGGVANPFARPFEYRPMRLSKKVAAGAEFIQTQAVFDLPLLERYMRRVSDLGLDQRVHILATVYVPRSARALEYMRDSIAGMRIPEETIRRMGSARDPEVEGLDLAVETIASLRSMRGIKGVHVIAVGWSEIVPVLLEKCGLCPRPEVVAALEAAKPSGLELAKGG